MTSKDKNKKRGLAPWVGNEPRILILGSLPGDESIAQQAYYQNPRNPFYKIMHTLFLGEEQCDDKEFVLSHHIALWDMLKSADREGSSDKNIKNEIPNDIQGFLNKYTSIHSVIINGKGKDYHRYFNRHFSDVYDNHNVIFLPQTASYISFEDKLAAWSVVKELVEREQASKSSIQQKTERHPQREESSSGLEKFSGGCTIILICIFFLILIFQYSYNLWDYCNEVNLQDTPIENITNSPTQPDVRTKPITNKISKIEKDPYYQEGYEKGLSDGQEDTNDGDYHAGFDDSNKYSGKEGASYRDGYNHGYEDGYEEVVELTEDGSQDIDEELIE